MLQKEDGHTAINNEVLEQLVKTPLLASEYQVILFVIRKTWGWHKKEDVISFSQFMDGTGLSRGTTNKTLKNLILRKILVRVTRLGKQKISYSFNKYYKTWLVHPTGLVHSNDKTSLKKLDLLVQGGRHTKETTKENKRKELLNLDQIQAYKELKSKWGKK